MLHGGHAGGIQSIRGPEASLGSLRVRLYMVSHLHRMRRRFEGLSANSLTTPSHWSMNYLAMASEPSGGRSAGVCGAGSYPLPDLPREASRSRSAPEKSV